MQALTKAYEWAEQQVNPAVSGVTEDILDYFMTNEFWEVIPHAQLIQPLPLLTNTALIAIKAEQT